MASNYLATAHEHLDALFVGPAGLAASLGYLGNPACRGAAGDRPCKARIDAVGKPAGIFALSPTTPRQRMTEGSGFISVGTDVGLLARGAGALLSSVRG